MALPQRLQLLSPSSVEKEILGETYRFYSVGVRTAAKLSSTIANLAGHIAVLMGGGQKDQGSTIEDYTAPGGEAVSKTHSDPINPDLAKLRADQRRSSVTQALTQLMDQKTRQVLGELLMDSMRDDFPRGQARNAEEAREFVDQMDLPVLVQFLAGLIEANKNFFGDLGNQLVAAFKRKAGEVLRTVDEPAETHG